MFSNETSVEEIKPLLREKQYSENQCDSKLKTFSAFLDIKTSIPESKKNFSIESSSTTVELLTDTLMGETKLVASQNIKYED